MTADGRAAEHPVPFIWATRGKAWGFRFLRTAFWQDPLEVYEAAFSGMGNALEGFQASAGVVAFRFPDPEKRCDAAGRVIPHEFVLFPPVAEGVKSLEEGFQLVWPLVKDDFSRVWDEPQPWA